MLPFCKYPKYIISQSGTQSLIEVNQDQIVPLYRVLCRISFMKYKICCRSNQFNNFCVFWFYNDGQVYTSQIFKASESFFGVLEKNVRFVETDRVLLVFSFCMEFDLQKKGHSFLWSYSKLTHFDAIIHLDISTGGSPYNPNIYHRRLKCHPYEHLICFTFIIILAFEYGVRNVCGRLDVCARRRVFNQSIWDLLTGVH